MATPGKCTFVAGTSKPAVSEPPQIAKSGTRSQLKSTSPEPVTSEPVSITSEARPAISKPKATTTSDKTRTAKTAPKFQTATQTMTEETSTKSMLTENEQKQLYRAAWRYCMSHYKNRTGLTGVGYIQRGIVACFFMTIAMAGFLRAVLEGGAFDVLVSVGCFIGGSVVFLRSVNWGIDRALEARSFAQSAVAKLDSSQDVKEFFDKVYPWIFH